jgi:hypothetical protein
MSSFGASEVKVSLFLKNCVFFSEGDIPEAILKSFLAVDAELKTYGNSTELTGSTGKPRLWQFYRADWQYR